ncbi:MAG: Fe-Mn family superoxide dismutase [Candidatus Micrarchaeia archaeon]|jgi:Fe-Mn family superoxide dismutase
MAAGMHVAKPLPFGQLNGISEKQISEHYSVLYQGYVKKLNEIELKLEAADRMQANATYSDLRELKLEEAFATNAIKLHEEYFSSLGGDGVPSGALADAIAADFGSVEKWAEDFKASGLCSRGWVVLAYNWDGRRLHNYSADYHTQGAWGATPLIVLDVYEHAYFLDFATGRKKYVEAYMANLDWTAANAKFEKLEIAQHRAGK